MQRHEPPVNTPGLVTKRQVPFFYSLKQKSVQSKSVLVFPGLDSFDDTHGKRVFFLWMNIARFAHVPADNGAYVCFGLRNLLLRLLDAMPIHVISAVKIGNLHHRKRQGFILKRRTPLGNEARKHFAVYQAFLVGVIAFALIP